MADAITVPTFEQIETILSKLATNYSNIAILFYDIFYNTTPMDVTLQMYDEAGILQTYTIPNRAKDMSNILNGSGSPQGVVEAGRGVIYQDLANGDLYIKALSDGSVGWTKFVTDTELSNMLIEGIGSPEAVVIANKGTLYIDKVNAALYIKAQNEGNTGWVLISANTENLANKDLNNLTAIGEAHFANPSLNNLNAEGQARFTAKENVTNKITAITSGSTDTQYPSAKAVYTFVGASTSNFADRDFSNITSIASAKFLGINKLRDCVLEATTIMYRGADNSFTLPYGTIILCANGLAANNTLNNTIITIDQNLAGVIPTLANKEGYILYDDTNGIVKTPTEDTYFRQVAEPEVTAGGVWFNPLEYTYHVVATINNEDVWVQIPMAEIGRWSTDSNGLVATFEPYYPVKVVSTESEEIYHVVVEVGGDEENWYRLYKDGWMEAGGYLIGGGVVPLLKEFKTEHYTLIPSANATSFTKSTDSFSIVAANNAVETDWVAYGWSA